MTGFLHHRLLADVAGAGLGWPSEVSVLQIGHAP
jgi:hypothetical protein